VGRNLEGDDHRFLRVGCDLLDTQGMEERRHIDLKCSKGSRQATQRYSALHAVEPNAASFSVCTLPQCGHAIFSSLRRKMRIGDVPSGIVGPGGAMPYCRSLRLPSSRVQSVVHAGARRSVARAGPRPSASMAANTFCSMTSVAGQPEYVGVSTTSSSPPWSITSRTMPRSRTESAGTSG